MAPFHDLGFSDVAAYQAAGNITFRSDDPVALEQVALNGALEAGYGFKTEAFVRTQEELETLTSAPHFTEDQLAQTQGKVQVSFMHNTADEEALAAVGALVPPEDALAFWDRAWLWLPARGVSDSTLPVGKVEKLVGSMTMRTMGTVERMLKKYG